MIACENMQLLTKEGQRRQAYAEECDSPEEWKVKQDYCWTAEVEIVDRVKQTSKSVLNFVKKKVGIGMVDEENLPQKCEYYACIFQQLHLLNGKSYPVYENIKEWLQKRATFNQAIEGIKQLDKCNDALTKSMMNEVVFKADAMDGEQESDSASEQSSCEIAAEFMKCLAQNQECPVFQYP